VQKEGVSVYKMTSRHNPRGSDTAICCGKRKNYKRYKGEDEEGRKAENAETRENGSGGNKKLKLWRYRCKKETGGRFLPFILIVLTGVSSTQGKTMHYGLVRQDLVSQLLCDSRW
jgi:hypothetical protein